MKNTVCFSGEHYTCNCNTYCIKKIEANNPVVIFIFFVRAYYRY